MFFQRCKTPGIAHLAYIIGENGQVAIVDPRRDVEEYLDILTANGLHLDYIFETHRQEDFEFGSADLRRITGAKVVTGDHACFGHSDIRLKDGEEIAFATLRFKALHTPGHTPESICWAVFHEAYPDTAWGVFTGDALFVGDTGRTDLPGKEETAENAGRLYDALNEKLLPLGDQAFVFPAHGAGTVCGGAASRDHTTLGLERTLSPVFTQDRDSFIRHRLAADSAMPRPPYFRLMEEVNLKGGRPVAVRANRLPLLKPEAFKAAADGGVVIDTREPEAWAGGHIPDSYSIWLKGVAMFGGWVVDERKPIYLVTEDADDLGTAVEYLFRLGRDNIAGALAGGFEAWRDAGMPVERSRTLTPRELAEAGDRFHVLDVREPEEFESGHIPGAVNLYVGYVEDQADGLPPGFGPADPIAVVCSVGHRAGLAVSMLKRRGYENVADVLGSMVAWKRLELPVEE